MSDHTATDTPQAAPAVGARLEPGVGRLEGRAAFEAWARQSCANLAKCDADGPYASSAVALAWKAWQAGRKHLIDIEEPAAWVFEWGAVALPHGHPSRITCMSARATEAEALALGASSDYSDFNWQVFPAYCVDERKPPNV